MPIPETSITVIRCRRSHATSRSRWASLTLVLAAPLLLAHTPAILPIPEARGAVVGQRSGHWATDVVDTATPLLLRRTPHLIDIDGTIERITWWTTSSQGGRSWRAWRCRQWRWWRRWKRRGRRRGWYCDHLRCGRRCRSYRAALVFGRATEHLLIRSPRDWPSRKVLIAIVASWPKQPQQEGKQQKQRETTNDCEIPPSAHHSKVTAMPDVPVRSLLNVVSVPRAHVHESAWAAISTTDSTSGALLALAHTARCSTTAGVAAVVARQWLSTSTVSMPDTTAANLKTSTPPHVAVHHAGY